MPVDDYYCQIGALTASSLCGGLIGGIRGPGGGVVIAASYTLSLNLESVLVYLYEEWVLKDSQSLSAHGNDVCGDEQRSLSDGPESKLGFLLFRSHQVPADQ